MTRLLLVDDEPVQLRWLQNAITARRPDVSVVTANDGEEAIGILGEQTIDVVVTDLQMPRMDGFELIAWLISCQPHVTVFTMTAHLDAVITDRLQHMGGLSCFSKPVKVPLLLDRIGQAVDGIHGHLHNISLSSVLQLIEMERKTCTLMVESAGRKGALYIDEGVLIHATDGIDEGDVAAAEVTNWVLPSISISGVCSPPRRTVERSMRFIIMESVRIQDEARRAMPEFAEQPACELDLNLDFELEPPPEPTPPPAAPASKTAHAHLSHVQLPAPPAGNAIAIADLLTGDVLTTAGLFSQLESVSQLVACIHKAEVSAVSEVDAHQRIQEVVLTTSRYWTLSSPLPSTPGVIAILVFEADRANLVIQRRELADVIEVIERAQGDRERPNAPRRADASPTLLEQRRT